jgi:hypothetical protein
LPGHAQVRHLACPVKMKNAPETGSRRFDFSSDPAGIRRYAHACTHSSPELPLNPAHIL